MLTSLSVTLAALNALTEPTVEARRQLLDAVRDVEVLATQRRHVPDNATDIDAWERATLAQLAHAARRLFPRERLVRLPDRLLPYVTGAKKLPRPGQEPRP